MSAGQSFLAIVNPAAGGGRSRKMLGPALERLRAGGIRIELAETRAPGEATNLARDIVAKPADIESSIRTVAETISKAGCRKVEYSRSCALIAHEIHCQLQSTSHNASVLFSDCLVSAVMTVFDRHYLKVPPALLLVTRFFQLITV